MGFVVPTPNAVRGRDPIQPADHGASSELLASAQSTNHESRPWKRGRLSVFWGIQGLESQRPRS